MQSEKCGDKSFLMELWLCKCEERGRVSERDSRRKDV